MSNSFPWPIPLKLTNHEDCPTRARRLQRVVHFIEARGGLPPTVRRLHDHKGNLHVCWSERPRELGPLRRIYAAWENEHECQVYHVIGDDPYAEPWIDDAGAARDPAEHLFRRVEYTIAKMADG